MSFLLKITSPSKSNMHQENVAIVAIWHKIKNNLIAWITFGILWEQNISY